MPTLIVVLTQNTQQIDFIGEYKTQVLVLQSVCVNFSNNTNTHGLIAIDSELFSHGNIHTNLCNGNLLVPIKTYKYSSLVYTNFRINEAHIPQSFLVTCYNVDCTTLFDFTNVANIILTFSFDQTSLL